jgi:polar amino acid transport system substrate-binding protein
MAIRATFAFLSLLLGPVLMGHASAAEPEMTEVRQILAPTGALRVALYPGTPTSVVSATDLRGVGYELGKALALRLGVPFKPVIFAKNADVLDAIKTGTADVAFTNASAQRAADMDFTQPYLAIELGFLVSAKSSIATASEVDRPGVRVGVTANSSSDATLSHDLKQAQLVRAETVASGIQMLAAGGLDVYATNKATLFEMADRLPGARILDGSWGMERHAFAIPKGRERGLGYARAFVADVVASGLVTQAADRAGLRGAVAGPPP